MATLGGKISKLMMMKLPKGGGVKFATASEFKTAAAALLTI